MNAALRATGRKSWAGSRGYSRPVHSPGAVPFCAPRRDSGPCQQEEEPSGCSSPGRARPPFHCSAPSSRGSRDPTASTRGAPLPNPRRPLASRAHLNVVGVRVPAELPHVNEGVLRTRQQLQGGGREAVARRADPPRPPGAVRSAPYLSRGRCQVQGVNPAGVRAHLGTQAARRCVVQPDLPVAVTGGHDPVPEPHGGAGPAGRRAAVTSPSPRPAADPRAPSRPGRFGLTRRPGSC